MNILKKVLALLVLAPSLAFAQTGTTTTSASLIADVNIISSNITVDDGTASGTFTAETYYGNQDNLHYGFVFRSKAGELIAASPVLGNISLIQKVPKEQAVTYKLPSVAEDSSIYLNIANDAGITLASAKVGEARGEASGCKADEKGITCKRSSEKVGSASLLTITAYRGGAHGKETVSVKKTLDQSDVTTILFSDIFKEIVAGRYLVVGEMHSEAVGTPGAEPYALAGTELVAVEYMKEGSRASIESVSIPDGASGFTAVVYTITSGFGTSTKFTLGLSSTGCVEVSQTPVKGSVTELMLGAACKSGTATVTLYQDGQAVDTETMSFAMAPAVKKDTNTTMYALIGSLILLAALAYVFLRKRGQAGGQSTTQANIAPVPAQPTVAASILLMAALAFVPLWANAATYVLDTTTQGQFCAGGTGGTCEVRDEVSTQSTITIANSVQAGATYTISVQQLNYTGGGNMVWCQDTSADGTSCDSDDVRTTASQGAQSSIMSHTQNASATFTAPSSAGTVNVSLGSRADAPYYFGCNKNYSPPLGNKCLIFIHTATTTHSLTVSAAPTVNVQFSFLDKLFGKVFAAGK